MPVSIYTIYHATKLCISCKFATDCWQILLLTLSKLYNFYSPWDNSKTLGFLMKLGGIEVIK